MNYGNILTTTWKTLWREKVIYAFGFLMMLAPALAGILIGVAMAFSSEESLERFVESDFGTLATFIILVVYFLFIALTIVMSGVSFSGVFKGTLLAQNSDALPLSFGALWEASMPFLWRMLGLMFSVGFALMLVFLVPMLLFMGIGALTAGIGFLCVLPFFLLMIPLSIAGYVLLSLSMAVLVAEDGSVIETLQKTWALLKANFWSLVLMAVILYVIQMGINLVAAVPMYILQFGAFFMLDFNHLDPANLFRYLGIFFAIYMPFAVFFQSVALTYTNGAWMLSYLDLNATPAAEDEIIEYEA